MLRAALAELEGGGEETEPVAVDTKEAAAQLRAKLGSPSLSERATALVARLEGTPHLDGRLDLSEFGVGEALAGPRNELWLPLGGGAGRGYQVGLGGGADAGGPELLVVAQFVRDRPWPRPARRGGGGLLDIYSRFGKSDRQVRGDGGDGDHPALAHLVVDVKVSPPTPASHNVIQSRTAQSYSTTLKGMSYMKSVRHTERTTGCANWVAGGRRDEGGAGPAGHRQGCAAARRRGGKPVKVVA